MVCGRGLFSVWVCCRQGLSPGHDVEGCGQLAPLGTNHLHLKQSKMGWLGFINFIMIFIFSVLSHKFLHMHTA